MKKRFQTPLCALSALVLAAACTTAAYAAEIPVPADAIPVPQAAPAAVPYSAIIQYFSACCKAGNGRQRICRTGKRRF